LQSISDRVNIRHRSKNNLFEMESLWQIGCCALAGLKRLTLLSEDMYIGIDKRCNDALDWIDSSGLFAEPYESSPYLFYDDSDDD